MRLAGRRTHAVVAVLAAVASLLVLLGLPRGRRVEACGPFFAQPVFVSLHVPDPPLDPFLAGRLGHVRPTWPRAYLAIAYRYLAGNPLDEGERKAALEQLQGHDVDERDRTPLWDWFAARRIVPSAGPDPQITIDRPVPRVSYASFRNCNGDAFEVAAATLRARAAAYGAASHELAEWLHAQDQVFSNCPGGRAVPEVLATSAPLAARQDRAYQIAAALFYATEYDAAEKAFRAIAQDATSPWRRSAPYLAVRCLVRRGTVTAAEGTFDRAPLEQADRELRTFARSAQGADREAAEALLGFVEARTNPVERTRQLGTAIERGHVGVQFKRTLWDYKLLLDVANGEGGFQELDERLANARGNFERLAAWRATSDLTDWIITFQAAGAAAAEHAFTRWRASQSPAWLVAALDKTTKEGANRDALLAAARAVEPGSPAYATLTCHAVRLLLEEGRDAEARESIDAVLRAKPDWPQSTRNEFLAWRMALARTLDEFVDYAPRVPAGARLEGDASVSEVQETGPRWQRTFDVDATAMLNRRLPLFLLAYIAESRALSVPLREEVGQSAWTRAVLLGDDRMTQRLFPFVERAAPSLKAELEAFRTEKTRTGRARAALFLLLKLPGLRPWVAPGTGRAPTVYRETSTSREDVAMLDDFRDNWWCQSGDFHGLSSYHMPSSERSQEPPWPSFLDQAATTAARDEDARMITLPTAPVVLCDRTVAWAKAAPKDPRVPEALYLAIRSSRYGCWTKDTTSSSRAAFRVLKTRYATTEWAQKTRYYY